MKRIFFDDVLWSAADTVRSSERRTVLWKQKGWQNGEPKWKAGSLTGRSELKAISDFKLEAREKEESCVRLKMTRSRL